MPTQFQLRRGTTTEHSTFAGAVGEVTIDTTKDTAVVHDGATNGGYPLAKETGSTFGNSNVSGNITFADNSKAIFGAGSDLQIYHDASNSYIAENGTGHLRIRASNLQLQDTSGNVYIEGVDTGVGGTVTLYHDANPKLATTSTGIDVTGTATMDGLIIGSPVFPTGVLKVKQDADNTRARGILLEANADDSLLAIGYNNGKFSLSASYNTGGSFQPISVFTSNFERLTVDTNGDISFYEETGTTPKLFWDASAERLGIGTASPETPLNVIGNGRFDNSAGTPVRLHINNSGSNDYASIYADTTTAYKNLVINPNGGNVGIGTDNPTVLLDLESTSPTIKFTDSNASGTPESEISGAGGDLTLRADKDNEKASSIIGFEVDGSEAMRIDNIGNLLVGLTGESLWETTAGCSLRPNGTATFTRDSNPALLVNLLGSDANLINFYKDNSTVGSIGVTGSGTQPYFVKASTGGFKIGNDGSTALLLPVNADGSNSDGGADLGASTNRFKDLYLSGGVYLGGTGSANKLDDYEEGTFVPVLSATTTAGSYTGTTAAKYTKVGNLVQIELQIQFTTFSVTPNGNWRLSNLPFVPATDGNAKFHLTFYNVDIDTTNHHVWHAYPTSASNIQFLFYRDNSTWVLGSTGNFQIGDGDIIGVSGTYLSA